MPGLFLQTKKNLAGGRNHSRRVSYARSFSPRGFYFAETPRRPYPSKWRGPLAIAHILKVTHGIVKVAGADPSPPPPLNGDAEGVALQTGGLGYKKAFHYKAGCRHPPLFH